MHSLECLFMHGCTDLFMEWIPPSSIGAVLSLSLSNFLVHSLVYLFFYTVGGTPFSFPPGEASVRQVGGQVFPRLGERDKTWLEAKSLTYSIWLGGRHCPHRVVILTVIGVGVCSEAGALYLHRQQRLRCLLPVIPDGGTSVAAIWAAKARKDKKGTRAQDLCAAVCLDVVTTDKEKVWSACLDGVRQGMCPRAGEGEGGKGREAGMQGGREGGREEEREVTRCVNNPSLWPDPNHLSIMEGN